MEKYIKHINMNKITKLSENLKYSSPVCETLACEAMIPLCVSNVLGTSEKYDESDYVWQVK